MAGEHPLAAGLRARHEPHRPALERVKAHIEGLEAQRKHRRKEMLAGAVLGAPIAGHALGRGLRDFYDRRVREQFAGIAGGLQPDDWKFMEASGLLPKGFMAEQRLKQQAVEALSRVSPELKPLGDLIQKNPAVAAAEKLQLRGGPLGLGPALVWKDTVRRDTLRADKAVEALQRFEADRGWTGIGKLSPELNRWLNRTAGTRIVRFLPHLVGGGVVAYLTQRKYKDLKKTPKELEDLLRNRDLRRYAVTDAIQNVVLPSMSLEPGAAALGTGATSTKGLLRQFGVLPRSS